MTNISNVTELHPYLNVAGSLRRVADRIDAGEFGIVKMIAAVMIHRNGTQQATLFGWGECTDLEVCGALSIGHHRALNDDLPP